MALSPSPGEQQLINGNDQGIVDFVQLRNVVDWMCFLATCMSSSNWASNDDPPLEAGCDVEASQVFIQIPQFVPLS